MVNLNPFKWGQNKQVEAVINATSLMTRSLDSFLVGVSKNGERDIYDVYGYERSRSFEKYYEVYRLQDVANRVVNSIARSCWRDGIILKQGDNKVYEEELLALTKRGLFKQIEKADILNRIGKFSLLYIGLPGQTAKLPLRKLVGKKNIEKVFFVPFAEDGIIIKSYEEDVKNERYGQPVMYTCRVVKRNGDQQMSTIESYDVHWSRVVHMCEGSLDSDVEGVPVLEPILNRLVDLDKTIGGAAEAYFRNARGKMALEADPTWKGSLSDEQKAALRTEVEAFQNNWQDVLRLAGMTAHVLDTPHNDPTGTVKVALEAISGATGIPMRILTGEGAGQLAGDEDKASYNQVIADRQKQLCSTWLMRIFEILGLAGVIEVQEDTEVEWPVSEVLNEKDQADVKRINAQALYALSQALSDMSPLAAEMSVQQAIEEIMGMKYKPEMVDEEALAELRELSGGSNPEEPERTEQVPGNSPSVD